MKKLLFVLSAIAVFSLLALGTSTAEPTHPNEVGLYLTPDGYGATGTFDVEVPVTVYLVLTKPADTENGDAPYSSINYFECQLNFSPNAYGNLFKLADIYPTTGNNVGDISDIGQGYLEYIMSFYEYVPVIDEAVVLLTIVFMQIYPIVTEVTLGPTSVPSVPGQMAFQSVPGQMRVMYSIGGSHESPVFIFQGEAVAVDKESFGSVKALYR